MPAHALGVLCVLSLSGAEAIDARQAPAKTSARSVQEVVASGVPVERDLASGQTHTYQLALGGEECVRVSVEQLGVDATIAVVDGSGRPVREENRLGEHGTELLLWTSPGPGAFTLTISARDKRASAGSYRLLVEISAAEEARKQAFEQYNDGWRLARQGRAGYSAAYASVFYTDDQRLQRALANFEAALPYWKSTADHQLTAVTLFQIGYLDVKLKQYGPGLERLREAADLFRESGQRTEQALVLNETGFAYSVQGDYANAGKSFTAALAFADVLPRDDAADLMFNHAVALQNLSKPEEALRYFDAARDAFRAAGKIDLELQAVSEIGRTHFAAGEMVQSLAMANEGLASSRAHHMPMLQARFAQDIGRVYLYLDDYERAREYCERSIALFRAERYINGEVATLLLLGDAQYGLNDFQAAQASYERAASLAHSNTFKEAEARAALKLGSVLADTGDFTRAVAQRQGALAYYRTTGNRRSEVSTLLALGKTYRMLGKRREAAATLEEGLRISREALGGFAETLYLGELALVARDDGRFEEAGADLTNLLRKFDAERRSLLAPSLSVTFVNGGQNWYAVYADLLMRQHEAHPDAGYNAQAWSAAEHAKAWGLLEMLAGARTDLAQSVDRALLDKQRALWAQMSARAAEAARTTTASSSSGAAAGGAAALDDLSVQLQLVEARIRADAPRYVELVEPQPLTPEQLQHELLDADTVLLEFALDEPYSWLWSVTNNAFESFKLGPRSEIDATSRHLHDLLAARQPRGGGRAPERALIAAADAELPTTAARLGHLLLAPIESRLLGEWRGKRLVVVASGGLAYVPFGVLTLSDGRQLLADHEIVDLPSATVLAALRREGTGRPRAARALALIGDPVFDRQDPRLRQSTSVVARADAPARRAASASRSDDEWRHAESQFTRSGFGRLPFTRQEIASIAALAPSDSVLQATDFRASHALAMSGELGQFRIVHFATHGLLNGQHPELSGLVLSLVDEQGRPQNGFLRLQEIYNLRLSADLVVLSACQTALGREVKGEGLVGLTRGFMYAGAQRVVASLWQVDDLATAALMKAFYRGMLRDGRSPASALRAAQLEIRAQKRWAAPYYWAPFTLQGEWR